VIKEQTPKLTGRSSDHYVIDHSFGLAAGVAALRDECAKLRDEALACCKTAIVALRHPFLDPPEEMVIDRPRTDSGSEDGADETGDGGWVDLGLEHSEIKFPTSHHFAGPCSNRKGFLVSSHAPSSSSSTSGGAILSKFPVGGSAGGSSKQSGLSGTTTLGASTTAPSSSSASSSSSRK